MFTFDWKVCPEELATVCSQSPIDDFSWGKESMPIRAVNNVATDLGQRTADRHIVDHDTCDAKNPDDEGRYKEFCSGCDCEGDCMESETCTCRLSRTDHERLCDQFQSDSLDYEFRRLYDVSRPVRSGIYECNQWCKCCTRLYSNRVAQRKINVPLELYKTAEMGWGLQSRVDLPVGVFVCMYEGAVKTNFQANTLGANSVYYADLECNESLERDKRGSVPSNIADDVEDAKI